MSFPESNHEFHPASIGLIGFSCPPPPNSWLDFRKRLHKVAGKTAIQETKLERIPRNSGQKVHGKCGFHGLIILSLRRNVPHWPNSEVVSSAIVIEFKGSSDSRITNPCATGYAGGMGDVRFLSCSIGVSHVLYYIYTHNADFSMIVLPLQIFFFFWGGGIFGGHSK